MRQMLNNKKPSSFQQNNPGCKLITTSLPILDKISLLTKGAMCIHTHITEGNGNSEGVGVKDPRILGGEGGWTVDLVFRCPSINTEATIEKAVQKSFFYILDLSHENCSLNTCTLNAFYLK